MATATSRREKPTTAGNAKRPSSGALARAVPVAVEISLSRRWPAVMLAVSRTARDTGRMRRLKDSIMIIRGMRGIGVPSGSKCPNVIVGWCRNPISTVASQIGTARARLKERRQVGTKVYGRRPRILWAAIKTIIDTRRAPHTWPFVPTGPRRCFVTLLANQSTRVRNRLSTSRREVGGRISQGRATARARSGMPRRNGLANWAKMPIPMVRFRIEGLMGLFLRV